MTLDWGIVVVAFNPEVTSFQQKITNWATKCQHIVVVNNGDTLRLVGATVVNMQGNRGIAAAHNAGISKLAQQGVTHAFLMDQDSQVEVDFFEAMLAQWQSLAHESQLGMLSPVIKDIQLNTIQSLFQVVDHQIQTVKQPVAQADPYRDTLPIASGCLVAVAAFQAVGGEQEDWFIDWVDFEFALALQQAGYQVLTTSAITMAHQIGKTTARHFLGKTIYPTNSQVFRDYYFVRNGLFLSREYGGVITNLHAFVQKKIRNRYLFSIYESQPFKRFGKLIKGTRDGLNAPLPTTRAQ